jgi:hypothetical protein
VSTIVQPAEGYAFVEYALVVNNKKLVFDPDTVSFISAELKDSVYTASTGLHTFRTTDPRFLESVKEAMIEANPVMRYRLGFGTPNQRYWLPWQDHIITNFYAKFQGIGDTGGYLFVFSTANDLVRMERANKVTARKGTISEIVTAIANENKLDYVIEPTDGKFMLYQSFIDDTRFVWERCIPRAITTKGRSGFCLYIRDNVLHFHTQDYQTTVREMNYYNVPGTELYVEDLSQLSDAWDGGLAGVRVVAHDPYTGETKEVESSPNNALRLADSIYQFGNVNNGQRNTPYHLSFNPAVEVNALAQTRYAFSRQKTFKCTASIAKTIVIRHGDLLDFNITQQASRASSYSGYYYVTGVFHSVKKQAVNSTYTLERGEISGLSQDLTVQSSNQQLVQVTKAPGQDPNIIEAQSSEKTKGAGKQSSATTYAAIADANVPLSGS